MTPPWYTPPAYVAPTCLEMVAQVARKHGLSASDLVGPSRVRAVCVARWKAMKVLRDKGRSLSSIGRVLNRNHATIAHGLRRAG